LVQNSHGSAWGNKGTGRILRGANVLESMWRGISTSPKKCTNYSNQQLLQRENNNKCLPSSSRFTSNGFYGGYGSLPFTATLAAIDTNSNNNQQQPSQNIALTVAADHLMHSKHNSLVINNIAIIGISFASALVITGLFLLVLRPRPPPHSYHVYVDSW